MEDTILILVHRNSGRCGGVTLKIRTLYYIEIALIVHNVTLNQGHYDFYIGNYTPSVRTNMTGEGGH